jgi:hypothetical protein
MANGADKQMIYQVFNHNGTLLGEFTTLAQAVREQNFYTAETGNDAYIEEKQA